MNAWRMREGDLSFEFSGAKYVEKLDKQGITMPYGMAFVDFVIEEDGRVLFVEVKDPSSERIPEQHLDEVMAREIRKFRTKELINELVSKARDSYCFLHLMKRDGKPFDFVFLTSLDRLGITKELLMNFRDRLLARLRKEADEEWKRQYVRNCAVHTVESWNAHLVPYRVERV